MHNPPASRALDQRAEATVRRLRTVLDEARGVIRHADDAQSLQLDRKLQKLQRDAERLAPDFASEFLRNGASDG